MTLRSWSEVKRAVGLRLLHSLKLTETKCTSQPGWRQKQLEPPKHKPPKNFIGTSRKFRVEIGPAFNRTVPPPRRKLNNSEEPRIFLKEIDWRLNERKYNYNSAARARNIRCWYACHRQRSSWTTFVGARVHVQRSKKGVCHVPNAVVLYRVIRIVPSSVDSPSIQNTLIGGSTHKLHTPLFSTTTSNSNRCFNCLW